MAPPQIGQLAPAGAPAPTGMGASGLGPPPVGSLAGGPVSAPGGVPAAVVPASSPALGGLDGVMPESIPALPSVEQIMSKDSSKMSAEEMVAMAKYVRSLEDMQGALQTLREADLRFPNSPVVLAEMAQCYEQMGLQEKATSVWRQIKLMDPARAGGYRDLADRRLNTPEAAPPPAPAAVTGFSQTTSASDAPKVLSLGACQETKDSRMTNGEKVVLRVPILRVGNVPVDPSRVDIDVFFFDRVNGEKVAQTIADEPVSSWTAEPVDWTGIGEEPIEVTYFMPSLTSGEVAVHGRRSYHGYVVKLYYDHKLQDVSANPRDLLDFGSRTPSAPGGGLTNPLLPPVPTDGTPPPAR